MGVKVGVFGATGLVGKVMRTILEERKFPVSELRLFASQKSQGEKFSFQGNMVPVETLHEARIADLDLVLASMPAAESRKWNQFSAGKGIWTIDNSSTFRMTPGVPLVIPEVNSQAITPKGNRLIANPNCSTIQMLVALNPLHQHAKIRRIVISTYQASSGKGAEALAELTGQAQAFGRGEAIPAPRIHAGQLFGNLLTQDWVIGETGFNDEETKIVEETKKILGSDSIGVAPTTVRVPVWNAHSQSIAVEFEQAMTLEEALAILRKAPGVKLADSPSDLTPLAVDGKDLVHVGRVRVDPTVKNGFLLWVVGDNLRKGAALNAIQIAEELRRREFLK